MKKYAAEKENSGEVFIDMNAIRLQVLISGIGGQGVLFLTRVLTQSALNQGLEVISSETHGMAMRGGTVISHVKVGAFRSPLIRSGSADVLMALDSVHAGDFMRLVREGGNVILNGKGARPRAPATDKREMSIDATGIASEMGAPQASNIVLLGFALARKALFCNLETAESAIKQITQQQRLDTNLKALRAGFSRGQAHTDCRGCRVLKE
ncbi:MAG: 2-oxoacid:acceptor oxidoreductase family protein [Deltaproteobacteria bacterium]|nr:2-oxoacid:acceptor oxidoreductase family protein [Deltaproteobacteria bacterium]